MHAAARSARPLVAWLAVPLLAALGLLGTAHGARSELFAGPLTVENIAARRLGGPDAVAGLGDYALGNGVVCAAISAPEHESTLSERGGVLIDLGHCGRDDDQWGVLQPMLNLSREQILPVAEIATAVRDGRAEVITRGSIQGLAFVTTYALDLLDPTRLLIETRTVREGPGEAVFLVGDVVLHGHRQLTPFTLDALLVHHGVGFEHPAIELDSAFSTIDAMRRADTHVLVGAHGLPPAISYGWRILDARIVRADGTEERLAHLAMNGEHFSILGVYADTLVFGGTGRPSMLELAQTLLMDVEAGEEVVVVREIAMTKRADAAGATDRIWAAGARVSGRAVDADAGLHVSARDGTPITFVRPEADGSFAFRLPPGARGRHLLRAERGGRVLAEREFEVPREAGSETDLGLLSWEAPATLALPRGEPMRLVFLGEPPTPDPRLGSDGLAFRVGDERVPAASEANHLSLAGVAGDPAEVRLPAGRYRVLATRGPEWSVSEARIALAAGEQASLAIEPPLRQVEAVGRMSADLHVHAAPSDDSALPLDERLRAFVAQGAQLIVSTEHDHVFDYAPAIEALGLGEAIASIVGVEVTSTSVGDVTPFTSGHANAFPLVPQPNAYRGGAPDAENTRLRDVLRSLRQRPGPPLLQLNHPREAGLDRGYGSYLSHLAVAGTPFEPGQALDSEANRALSERDPTTGLRDLDFDAIELLNGSSMEAYRLTRADWLSLLLQGERRTATANSDSHDVATLVALPRNYIAYTGGLARALDREALLAALRAGRVTGSTGPLLEATLGGAGPGETFRGTEGALVVRVARADWVPADELRVFVDGTLVHRGAAPVGEALSLPLRFARDAAVTVEVEGRAEPGSLYALIAPGFTPFAFSNAILVDADGRPGWSAPGLPDPLPPVLAAPLEAP